MKKVFLRITPTEKPNKNLKTLDLCYWPIDFRKNNYTLDNKNFFKTQNNKNRIKKLKLAHQISIKIINYNLIQAIGYIYCHYDFYDCTNFFINLLF